MSKPKLGVKMPLYDLHTRGPLLRHVARWISQELIEQKCFVLFNAWATWNVWIAAGLRSMCECLSAFVLGRPPIRSARAY